MNIYRFNFVCCISDLAPVIFFYSMMVCHLGWFPTGKDFEIFMSSLKHKNVILDEYFNHPVLLSNSMSHVKVGFRSFLFYNA